MFKQKKSKARRATEKAKRGAATLAAAYEEGKTAFDEGKIPEANPYISKWLRDSWQSGFTARLHKAQGSEEEIINARRSC